MCGRCRCTLRVDDVPRACHLRTTSVRHVDVDRYRPSHNVSPGSYIPVLRRESGGGDGHTAAVHCMKWGLVPSFTKKDEKPDHYKMFNARSESVSEKASFRRLVPNNRCLVAVEGFYEWKKGPKKQPYYIHFKDNRPLVFAALYDSWKNAEGEVLYTFTILTTDSSSPLKWLHDRMPVILGDETSTDMWLNGSSDTKFSSLLKPYEKSDLVWYPVTSEMNKASFDGPDCIKEIPLKSEVQSNPITKFFSKKPTVDDDKVANISNEKSTKIEITSEIEEAKPEKLSLEAAPSTAKIEPKREYEQISAEPKREYEQISAESKPIIDGYGKLPTTPLKKSKFNKSGAEKQATLRSYFGKS